MKHALIALAVALTLAGCTTPTQSTTTTTLTTSGTTPSTPASNTSAFTPDITIQQFKFTPADYSEDLGGTVSWQNLDAGPHTVTADDGTFDSGPITTGAAFNFTTTKAGAIPYHCKFHSTMHGTLTVAAPTATTPSSTTTTTTTTTTTPPTPVPVTDGQVAISGFDFQPKTLAVARGANVTWTNADSVPHTVTSDTGAFNSGDLARDGAFTFAFPAAGTYAYHCMHHSGMRGTITVS